MPAASQPLVVGRGDAGHCLGVRLLSQMHGGNAGQRQLRHHTQRALAHVTISEGYAPIYTLNIS